MCTSPSLTCSVLVFIVQRLSNQQLLDVTIQALPLIKSAGFTEVEVYLRNHSYFELKKLAKTLKLLGLKLKSIHFHKPMLLASPQEALQALRHSIITAHNLGANMGIVHPYYNPADPNSLERFIFILEKILPLIEAFNFDLSIETVPVPNPKHFYGQIFQEMPSPSLSLTLDCKFMTAMNYPPTAFIDAFSQHLSAIHVNDYLPPEKPGLPPCYPPLGHGRVNFTAMAHALAQNKFLGQLTLETSIGLEREPVKELIRCHNIMRNLLALY